MSALVEAAKAKHGVPGNAFLMRLTVAEEDIDEQGRVSNVTIVKWVSRSAYQHSCALGYDVEKFREIGSWFVIRRHEVDYMQPALLGDEVLVFTWPSGIAKVSATRDHVMLNAADGAVIAKAHNTWAYIDAASNRPVRIPQDMHEVFDPAKFAS